MTNKVLDFNEKRQANIEKKRRNFERIVFQNFLGAYSVIDQDGSIFPVTLVDISYDGCLFQTPWDVARDTMLEEESEIKMRMYFSKHSFVPVILTVKNGREHVDHDGQTYMQYGCEFDKSMQSFEAMEKFIDFLYKFAEHSAFDKGTPKTFFL